ncbi:hypothetical protein RMATCC62417_10893 [Rhizopus microsporus]|nr:hypothetical protein RMATCC62417_10893 [Rhizopus microsporus]
MPIINISDNLTTHVIPEYDYEVTTIRFANEAGFEKWFSNIAQKHANWNLRQSWTNEKAKPFLGQSLAASMRLHTIKHQYDHAGKPKKRKEFEVSTKKAQTKESIKIEENVNQNVDWKPIKNLRRMDEVRLLHIEQNGISSSFPPSLRINYYDVRNVINARLMKLSRRVIRSKDGVQIWMEELVEKGAKTLFKVHEDGPFLASWVAKWQMKRIYAS